MSIIVSFFDQFPTFEGKPIEIRGEDGYISITDLNVVLKKRFTDWRKSKFAQELLDELSKIYRVPIDWENSPSRSQKPLVDYVRGNDGKMFAHPAVALSYCNSNARFQARVNAWVVNMMKYGTATMHVQDWTALEVARGFEYNRDDIREMYG